MLGLANLLRHYQISYEEFGNALMQVNTGITPVEQAPAYVLAKELQKAINTAAEVAKQNGMVRSLTIAPTASCSYRYQDLDGFTTTPEIAPPIARHVDRDSGTFGVESFDYGPVEIAAEVGWDAYNSVANGIVTLLDKTGQFHGYSYNSWSDVVTYDEQFIENWINSPQTSLYYALQVMPDTQRKDDALSALDDDFRDLFGFDEVSAPADDFCISCAE
jgi:hypothetical protein